MERLDEKGREMFLMTLNDPIVAGAEPSTKAVEAEADMFAAALAQFGG